MVDYRDLDRGLNSHVPFVVVLRFDLLLKVFILVVCEALVLVNLAVSPFAEHGLVCPGSTRILIFGLLRTFIGWRLSIKPVFLWDRIYLSGLVAQKFFEVFDDAFVFKKFFDFLLFSEKALTHSVTCLLVHILGTLRGWNQAILLGIVELLQLM